MLLRRKYAHPHTDTQTHVETQHHPPTLPLHRCTLRKLSLFFLFLLTVSLPTHTRKPTAPGTGTKPPPPPSPHPLSGNVPFYVCVVHLIAQTSSVCVLASLSSFLWSCLHCHPRHTIYLLSLFLIHQPPLGQGEREHYVPTESSFTLPKKKTAFNSSICAAQHPPTSPLLPPPAPVVKRLHQLTTNRTRQRLWALMFHSAPTTYLPQNTLYTSHLPPSIFTPVSLELILLPHTASLPFPSQTHANRITAPLHKQTTLLPTKDTTNPIHKQTPYHTAPANHFLSFLTPTDHVQHKISEGKSTHSYPQTRWRTAERTLRYCDSLQLFLHFSL